MYLDLEQKDPGAIAAVDETGCELSYGDLANFSGSFADAVGSRSLLFILASNTVGSLSGYIASLASGLVPLLVSADLDRQLLQKLIELYQPGYLWAPDWCKAEFPFRSVLQHCGYALLKTGLPGFSLHPQLALLLTTSGSTGSPKLVRHSYANLEFSARSVAEFFDIQERERSLAALPMQYTMGLSVINSHLCSGATVLLAASALTESSFWTYARECQASSFTGVPYSYEVLDKLRFYRMNLPHLNTLSQGGGKLPAALFQKLADFCQQSGRKFYATYGQTEGTARMAYLPPELAVTKTCSIGRAIPGGELALIDESGGEIKEMAATGEMVYRGPNVTWGYAYGGEDLIKGDEREGVLPTGDIARRDSDGCYYIVGRKSRFLKIYGLRVSLDEIETMVREKFGIECLCAGRDDKLQLVITKADSVDAVRKHIIDKTGIQSLAVEISCQAEIPRNEFGKVLYT